MNYCTRCGTKAVGRYCGHCGLDLMEAQVLVGDHESDAEVDEVEEQSGGGGGGGMVVAAVVIGLLLLVGYGATRPDIDKTSPAFAEGRQVATTYIASGGDVKAYTTATEICVVEAAAEATDEIKAAAANREAGCKAALDEHLKAHK